MQKNTSVTLGKHFEVFINQQIKIGRYSSASEAIRAGLRLLEEKEIKMATLRKALVAGEQSGYGDYSFNAIIKELDQEETGVTDAGNSTDQ